MNHHYVLAPHNAPLAARAEALVADHQPGHGVRAIAHAREGGEFGHVIALQAADDDALQTVLDSLELPPQRSYAAAPGSTDTSTPLMLTVCGDVPCEQINRMFSFVPSHLPVCEEIVFLIVELAEDLHDIVDRLVLPPVDSHLAGVAISDGNLLLLELANDDPEQLRADLERLRAHADIRSIRTVHAAGPSLVRSPHV